MTRGVIAECCSVCEDERIAKLPLEKRLTARRFVACKYCGNKRCPKASSHKNACTNSNEPGQVGSFYGPKESWPHKSQEPEKP